MKIQDVIFIVLILILLSRRNPKEFVIAGILNLAFAIPLFFNWVFFTAQRFTYYAAAFFLIAVILNILRMKNGQE